MYPCQIKKFGTIIAAEGGPINTTGKRPPAVLRGCWLEITIAVWHDDFAQDSESYRHARATRGERASVSKAARASAGSSWLVRIPLEAARPYAGMASGGMEPAPASLRA